MILANSSNNTSWYVACPTMETECKEPFLSDELKDLFLNIICVVLFGFGMLGVATNAINIRVFIQQGLLSDSNTLGLFALTVADLLGCVTTLPLPVCQVMKYTLSLQTHFTCYSYTSVSTSILHLIMFRLTCCITVYITVERSLCVLTPFKIKSLLRPKVTMTAMTIISLLIISPFIPIFISARIIWRFNPRINATVAAYDAGSLGRVVIYYASFAFNNVLTTLAFVIVIITTALMIHKLKESRKWRKSATGVRKCNNDSADNEMNQTENTQGKRDLEVMKIVTLITSLFLVCLSVSHIPGFAAILVDGVNPNGLNENVFYLTYHYKMMFDVINSSLNFFFYIRVSSRYKKAFHQVFGK